MSTSTRQQRLQSVRSRIAIIRSVLEDANAITNVSVSGVSETVDRVSLRSELRDLEREEEFLSGHTRICRTVDMRGTK